MLGADNDELAQHIGHYRIDGDWLEVRAIKGYADGALGSHGAWLLEPYSDQQETAGLNVTALEDLETRMGIALESGFQIGIHAIGDRANREVLDLYEKVLGQVEDGTSRRWRIEHAQHLHPDDIPRFAELGIIAAMQPIHCTSDGPWVPQRLGEERSRLGAYVWRSLLASGATISSGTDVPVEPIDPLANFFAAVTRELPDGSLFFPEQRMSREEALRAMTLDAAYAAFQEGSRGSLTPGKLADITVLSRDILTVPEDEIRGTEVLYTIVGGEVRYEKN
jgi:predicted amidohydrolase YtcJ